MQIFDVGGSKRTTSLCNRREVLQALGIPCLMTKDGLNEEFTQELDFSRELIEENQKNYQVWHHRKILVSWAAGFSEETGRITLECKEARLLLTMQELELTIKFLKEDAKNYHAWQHRQWVLTTFG
jgi:protein farnesyltransferase/geranylgeranyltransferase type-1 subunit alpha